MTYRRSRSRSPKRRVKYAKKKKSPKRSRRRSRSVKYGRKRKSPKRSRRKSRSRRRSRKTKRSRSPSRTKTNPKLYAKIVSEAKRKFDVWPSIYASSWVVQQYKKRGGGYSGKKPQQGLTRWYKEKWIDVCKLPKIVQCGRSSPPKDMKKWKSTYPYCRPMYKVSKGTPRTARTFSPAQIKRRCSRKKRSPGKKIR